MSYLIDRQAVIDLLKQMRKDGDMVPWEGKDVFARIRKLPTIQPEKAQLSQEGATSDLISRQAAIDALMAAIDDVGILDGADIKVVFDNLPPAQPEPQEGHWINGKCDLCGEHAPFWCMASTYHESNYCPRCGARMKGERQK